MAASGDVSGVHVDTVSILRQLAGAVGSASRRAQKQLQGATASSDYQDIFEASDCLLVSLGKRIRSVSPRPNPSAPHSSEVTPPRPRRRTRKRFESLEPIEQQDDGDCQTKPSDLSTEDLPRCTILLDDLLPPPLVSVDWETLVFTLEDSDVEKGHQVESVSVPVQAEDDFFQKLRDDEDSRAIADEFDSSPGLSLQEDNSTSAGIDSSPRTLVTMMHEYLSMDEKDYPELSRAESNAQFLLAGNFSELIAVCKVRYCDHGERLPISDVENLVRSVGYNMQDALFKKTMEELELDIEGGMTDDIAGLLCMLNFCPGPKSTGLRLAFKKIQRSQI
eukprot:gnl/TRDRNA2_/TRDRNA2_173328_c0_seq1.p1 gnl/TRDRNA2_/TRDRNA2_173328_c0~~gnl/TRDRNA2_/TRDRNA2_173328_c0_seq1.p1  ORF type:complete len:334 (-),score=28.00 gnl/TRDRNA2_/TRDRNA2_173328_c0_seq1:219-1220(-)